MQQESLVKRHKRLRMFMKKMRIQMSHRLLTIQRIQMMTVTHQIILRQQMIIVVAQ